MNVTYSLVDDVNASQNESDVSTSSNVPRGQSVPDMFMSFELLLLIDYYMILVVRPIIGIIGIAGNIISGIVLIKAGLKKPSNILLFALAIGDIWSIVEAVNIATFMQYLPGKIEPGLVWEMAFEPAYAMFLIKNFLDVASAYGLRLSTTITVFITFERLFAIFFPLHFQRVVTATKAWVLVIGAFIFWLPWTVFMWFWRDFYHSYSTYYDAFYGMSLSNDVYDTPNLDVPHFNTNVINNFSHTIPLVLVTVGCVVIAVKVNITAQKRKKMVSDSAKKKGGTSRTTKTLLAVCLVYSITHFTFLFKYLPQIDMANVYWSNFAYIIYMHLMVNLTFVNSGCNFFIYVVFNHKFRHIIQDMLVPKCCLKNKAGAVTSVMTETSAAG